MIPGVIHRCQRRSVKKWMKIKKNDNQENKPDFFDKPENIQKMLKVFYVLCGLLVVADFILYRKVLS